MSNVHLVIGAQGAHCLNDNSRADLLAKLIIDLKPNVVVNLGNAADLPSLSRYHGGKKALVGRTYQADIDVHCDFQDRIWRRLARRKKKMPRRVFCVGNREESINAALYVQPELRGAISFSDLRLSEWYNEVVPYEGSAPGNIEIDGVLYAHYFTGSKLGHSIRGRHRGHTLLRKLYQSATMGDSQLLDYCARTRGDGRKIHGLSVGCFQDDTSDWAGGIVRAWDRGVVIKKNVDGGAYDLEWVSLSRLEKEYI